MGCFFGPFWRYDVHMRLQELHDIADDGLKLYVVTRDPLTFSAAKLLLQATSSTLNPTQDMALGLLQRQLEAYKVLYTDPLV